jgi:hypothetical protein
MPRAGFETAITSCSRLRQLVYRGRLLLSKYLKNLRREELRVIDVALRGSIFYAEHCKSIEHWVACDGINTVLVALSE